MKKQRTFSTELPSFQEAKDMVRTEGSRFPVDSKKDIHYPDFSCVIRWLEKVGLDGNIFVTKEDPQVLLSKAEEIKPFLIKKTLDLDKKGNSILFEEITKYLGESDSPEKSNIILVFGSSNLLRMDKGVELWKKGIAPLILITGGHPFYKDNKTSEAVVFRDYAIEKGVPKENLLIEPESINIPDNVKRSLNILDEMNFDYLSKGITTVSAWFVNRRIWCHLMKLSPEGIKIYRTSPESNSKTLSKENWYKNEEGIAIVFNEFVKMRVGVLFNNIA